METEQTSFWKRMWVRRIALALVSAVAILFGLFWLGLNMDDILRWKSERTSVAYDAMIANDMETLRKMEMADTYGSTTPEGTIALIITALESGDIELASKYYYVLDQEKQRVVYKEQIVEQKNLNASISFLEKLEQGTKICNLEMNECMIEVEYIRTQDEYVALPGAKDPVLFKKGSTGIEGLSFSLNEYSGFWKAKK